MRSRLVRGSIVAVAAVVTAAGCNGRPVGVRFEPEPRIERPPPPPIDKIDLLSVDVSIMPGNKDLVLTGQLGDVMQESARAAISVCQSLTHELGLADDFFDNHTIHIHVPAGAVPKDGPSAGITMATALISALTGVPIRRDVAMTGEITLRGKVLPIGGLREKALAARRGGISTFIAPTRNEKDLEEIPEIVRKELDIKLVSHISEAVGIALTKPVLREVAAAAS